MLFCSGRPSRRPAQVGGAPERAFAAAARTWVLVCHRTLADLSSGGGAVVRGGGEVARLVTSKLSEVWPGMVPLQIAQGGAAADPEADAVAFRVVSACLSGRLKQQLGRLRSQSLDDYVEMRRKDGFPDGELTHMEVKRFVEAYQARAQWSAEPARLPCCAWRGTGHAILRLRLNQAPLGRLLAPCFFLLQP